MLKFLWIAKEKNLMHDFINAIMDVLNSQKIFKAYYGFWVLYAFSFPIAGHWPVGSGRDKVDIRAWVFIADLKLSFCVFLTLLRY